jgi:hypothetical protein
MSKLIGNTQIKDSNGPAILSECKSSVCKNLDSVSRLDRRPASGFSTIYFPSRLVWGGGVVKSLGFFKLGPRGYRARISAKFQKLFLLGVLAPSRVLPGDESTAGGNRARERQPARFEN